MIDTSISGTIDYLRIKVADRSFFNETSNDRLQIGDTISIEDEVYEVINFDIPTLDLTVGRIKIDATT